MRVTSALHLGISSISNLARRIGPAPSTYIFPLVRSRSTLISQGRISRLHLHTMSSNETSTAPSEALPDAQAPSQPPPSASLPSAAVSHLQQPTPMSKSAIDETHPRFGGVYIGDVSRPDVKTAIESADLVFSVGGLQRFVWYNASRRTAF